jgi:hypothetical protein
VVDEVTVPRETDGTWTVIDWDNIEAAPEREWRQFDVEDKDFIRKNCPDDHAKFFSQFDRKENANNAGNLD